MSESLSRRKLNANVRSVLLTRRGLLDRQQTIYGDSAQVRNPAWIQITGTCKMCGNKLPPKTLPEIYEHHQDVYRFKGGSIKPAPTLKSVTITNAGDWGLARRISAEIECYTLQDFKEIQQIFLMPGNEISAKFGYKKSWGFPKNSSDSLSGFKVATFSFNTTQEGSWLCTFEAVSSATAIKNLDMQIVVCNGCNPTTGVGQSGTSGPLKYLVGKQLDPHPVKGVAQLIASDAQKNGQYSIDDIKDGDVIQKFVSYSPGSLDTSAAIVVYTGDHLRNMFQKFTAWIGGIVRGFGWTDSEVQSANNQVFVSIGYVVNRIINDQLLRAMACGVIDQNGDRSDFSKLKIEFHPEYSKCRLAAGITSGDPTSVLLLGDANYKNHKGAGKDFDGDCQNLGAVRAISSGEVNIKNILIHRDVVVAAFNDATKKREAESDTTDVKDSKDQVINIIDFFEKVSDHISASLGGAISLRIVEHPDDLKKLLVVDQNYGVIDKLECIVLDPINGDGSTRECNTQSSVGSEEYKAAMYVGVSKNGDPISALRGCDDSLKQQRQSEYSKAKSDKDALIKNPGNLGENEFDGQEINALKSVMGRMHRNNPSAAEIESIHYPGLSINATLDGVWGFEPGMAISTSQVPPEWINQNKAYFMITRVQHNFADSDWSTSLEGILAYYPNVKPVFL